MYRLFNYYYLVFSCVALYKYPLGSAVHCQDDSCASGTAAECENVSAGRSAVLLQTTADHARVGVGELRTALPHVNARLDQHMSKQQIRAELQLAELARQQWDEHIASLHGLLDNPKIAVNDIPTQSHQVWSLLDPKFVCLVLIGSVFALYGFFAITQYEAQRNELDCPWYHDGVVLSKVLGVVCCLWLIIGMACFTEFFHFKFIYHPHYPARPLTVIESVYMSVQILTTVGYGDIEPVTSAGKLFMAFYIIIGVALVASLFTQFLSMFLDWEVGDEPENTFRFWQTQGIKDVACMACILFGTIFFGLLSGEKKTYFESFYMSILTLTTVGFGDQVPITPVGQVVGSIWMMVSVVCWGRAIAICADGMLQNRRNLKTKASAISFFHQISKEHNGEIDRLQFVGFELTRCGLSQAAFDGACAKFDEVDDDHSGSIQFEEFEKYIDSLEFE